MGGEDISSVAATAHTTATATNANVSAASSGSSCSSAEQLLTVPTALRVSGDAKKFATSLQGEILTRLEQQSANLDKLFDAENLR